MSQLNEQIWCSESVLILIKAWEQNPCLYDPDYHGHGDVVNEWIQAEENIQRELHRHNYLHTRFNITKKMKNLNAYYRMVRTKPPSLIKWKFFKPLMFLEKRMMARDKWNTGLEHTPSEHLTVDLNNNNDAETFDSQVCFESPTMLRHHPSDPAYRTDYTTDTTDASSSPLSHLPIPAEQNKSIEQSNQGIEHEFQEKGQEQQGQKMDRTPLIQSLNEENHQVTHQLIGQSNRGTRPIEQNNQFAQPPIEQSNRSAEQIIQKHHSESRNGVQLVDSNGELTPVVVTSEQNKPEQPNNPEDLHFGSFVGITLRHMPECMEKAQLKFEIQENIHRVRRYIDMRRSGTPYIHPTRHNHHQPQHVLHPYVPFRHPQSQLHPGYFQSDHYDRLERNKSTKI